MKLSEKLNSIVAGFIIKKSDISRIVMKKLEIDYNFHKFITKVFQSKKK